MHMGALGCCISCGKNHNIVADCNDGVYSGSFACCGNIYSFSGTGMGNMNIKFTPNEKLRNNISLSDEIGNIAKMVEAAKLSKENSCARHNMPLILSTGIGRPVCPGCVNEGVKNYESKNRSNMTLVILISMLAAAAATAGFNGTVEKIASLLPSEILNK